MTIIFYFFAFMKKLFLSTLCACLLASCSLSTSNSANNYTPETAPKVNTETVSIDTTTNTQTPVVTPKVQSTKTTSPTPQETPTVTVKTYTSAEVAQHSTASDCWMILDNGVYDVTSFIPRHPGGDKILRGCGRDATQMFSQHPESAKAMKEQFKIGVLAQ